MDQISGYPIECRIRLGTGYRAGYSAGNRIQGNTFGRIKVIQLNIWPDPVSGKISGYIQPDAGYLGQNPSDTGYH